MLAPRDCESCRSGNRPPRPGRLRYVFTPAGTFEEMVRKLYALSAGGVPDMDEMARVAMEHGQEFVGPPLE